MWFLAPLVFAGYKILKGQALPSTIRPDQQDGHTGKAQTTAPRVYGDQNMYIPRSQIDAAAYSKFQTLARENEGYRLDVYKDSVGRLTVGIGHLVTRRDNLRFGERIGHDQVMRFFAADGQKAFNAARQQALQLNRYTVDFIAALAEVNFQLGDNWRRKFSNTWSLLARGDARQAIKNIESSLWASQTPTRTANFVAAIKRAYSVA